MYTRETYHRVKLNKLKTIKSKLKYLEMEYYATVNQIKENILIEVEQTLYNFLKDKHRDTLKYRIIYEGDTVQVRISEPPYPLKPQITTVVIDKSKVVIHNLCTEHRDDIENYYKVIDIDKPVEYITGALIKHLTRSLQSRKDKIKEEMCKLYEDYYNSEICVDLEC